MIDLEELYAIDPSLREHESDLKKLLAKLEKAKPGVKVDPAFVADLRRELLNKELPATNPVISFLSMPYKPYLIGTGALAVLAIALVTATQLAPSVPSGPADPTPIRGGVIALGPSAFGDLSGASVAADGRGSSEASSVEAPAEPPASLSVRPQSGGGGFETDESKLIAYPEPYQTYTLEYDGEAFELPSETMDVYRRVKDLSTASALGRAVAGAPNGVLDLARFGNVDLGNFTVTTGGRDGYEINIDIREARAYIGPNYLGGYVETAYDRQYSRSDVPADGRLIAAARAFLDRFGVDAGQYGEPVVDRHWERYVILEESRGSTGYVPPVITVTFPYLAGSEVVHDQGGMPYGMSVGVRISDVRAVSAYNITPQVFESSAYQLETDWSRIERIAERGGLYGFWYGSPEGGTIRLGGPELVYTYVHHYDQASQQGMELYAPALRFPLLDMPEEAAYGPQYVFVPLVKDILDAYGEPGDVPPGEPRPLPVEPLIMEQKDEAAQ